MWQALATTISPSRVLKFSHFGATPTAIRWGHPTECEETPWSCRQNHRQSRFASQGGIVSRFIMRHGLENTLSFGEKYSVREKKALSGELGYRWSRLLLWVQ